MSKRRCALEKRFMGNKEIEINYRPLYHLIRPVRAVYATLITRNHDFVLLLIFSPLAEAASERHVLGPYKDPHHRPPHLQLYRCLQARRGLQIE